VTEQRPLELRQGEVLNAQTRDGSAVYFNVTRELGRGGGGIVWEAIADDGRVCVVKGPKLVGARSPQLEREAELLATLPEHPNLIRLLGTVRDPRGHVLLILERVFENPLKAISAEKVRPRLQRALDPKAREVPLPISTALELGYELALALEHLHHHRFAHCDVKPANFLVALDWREAEIPDREYFDRLVKGPWLGVLIDMGGVRTFKELADATARVRGTPPPIITPLYAPPEVIPGFLNEQGAERSRFTPWIDVYAAGLTIYQLLTGWVPYAHVKRPPDGRDLRELAQAKRDERDGVHRPIARQALDKIDWSDCQLEGRNDEAARAEVVEKIWTILARVTGLEPSSRNTARKLREDLAALLGVEERPPVVDSTAAGPADARVVRAWTARRFRLDAFASRLAFAARDGTLTKRDTKISRRGEDFWEMQGFQR
jgi:serine/threonine protein kinase